MYSCRGPPLPPEPALVSAVGFAGALVSAAGSSLASADVRVRACYAVAYHCEHGDEAT